MSEKHELMALMQEEVIEAEVVGYSTGLSIAKHHYGDNGFTYASGVREFGKLSIVEEVVKGTSVTFLSGVQVYDEHGTLIIDYAEGKNTYYSREKVRVIILEEFLSILQDAAIKQQKTFDEKKAGEQIDSLLNDAYYSESYEAILNWAKDVGIKLLLLE